MFDNDSMAVFLVKRDTPDLGYGVTDSAVVIAKDEDDAREVMAEFSKTSDENHYVWFHPREVTVNFVAELADGGKRGVVLSHETPQ